MAKTDILAKMAELLGIPYRPRATGKKTGIDTSITHNAYVF